VRTDAVREEIDKRLSDLGAFIRDQRNSAEMSMRKLADVAGVSNPYLSQIERGLRKPSAEILQQIAKALRISAETLYQRAGILEPSPHDSDARRAIDSDPKLTAEQRATLLRVYDSFRLEHAGSRASSSPGSSSPASDDPAGS
jgi:transcriptional regulator with XRE-family HTH domain